jgi:hypothetical protein
MNLSKTLNGDSVVVQQRSSLLICWNNGTASECELFAEDTRNSNREAGEEKDSHDDKGKDPLDCNGMGEELSNANGG